MSLALTFSGLFKTPKSLQQLASLGVHVSVDSFSLTTTSLRHLDKWFERLENIDRGISNTHSNYFSDPAAIGLVEKRGSSYSLTNAGRSYLSLKIGLFGNPERAEYELLKILYFSGHSFDARSKAFLSKKRNNLFQFLTSCRPTPARTLILEDPRLLAIGEILEAFDGALVSFLQLPDQALRDLSNLSTAGFKALFNSDNPPGIRRINAKIGEDYSRAPGRRTNYLFSMLLLEILSGMRNAGVTYQKLKIPYPFCNLITEQDLYLKYDAYTQDLQIENIGSEYIATLNVGLVAPSGSTTISVIERTFSPPRRRLSTRTPPPAGTPTTRRAITQKVLIDLSLGQQAEDYVESLVLRPEYNSDLVRIGHTNFESIPLADGLVPGADFYVKDSSTNPVRFIEIKATKSTNISSITLTAGEIRRIKFCIVNNIPYDVLFVCYGNSQGNPEIIRPNGLSSFVASMTLEDARSVEIPISY